MKRTAPFSVHKKRAIYKRFRVKHRRDEEIKSFNRAISGSRSYKRISVKKKRIIISAPKELCLYKRINHQKLIIFIKQLRKIVLLKKLDLKIDFSKTTFCGASGVLLLVAELDRIYSITKNNRCVTGCNIKDETVRQVFKQIGLGKKLRIKDDIEITSDDVKHWKYITGEGTEGSIAGELIEQFSHQVGDTISEEIYGAYIDAIDNVAGHAYVEKRCINDKFSEQRWWVFAEIKNGRFITAACDLGMGIPRSLPAQGMWEFALEQIDKAKLKKKDAHIIKAAFELTRTSTGEKKHGKGLQKMRNIVRIIGEGHISIYSNSGLYKYSILADGTIHEELHTTKNIMGTIVEWNVRIDSK
jgi:anti-anti-sigma regulatory factor